MNWLNDEAEATVYKSVIERGLTVRDTAQAVFLSHPEARTYWDRDITVSRWADDRWPHLTGVQIIGHSDDHKYLYLWGTKDDCEVFHIRIWEPGLDVFGEKLDPLKYLDERDVGYVLSMVKGAVMRVNDKTRYSPMNVWTLRGLPDVRVDPSWLLREVNDEGPDDATRRMSRRPPIRVVGTNENLSSYGLFGTVVGSERGEGISRESYIKPGVMFNVIWLDYPDEGSDEIDGGNLKVVSETTFQIEVVERKLDGGE